MRAHYAIVLLTLPKPQNCLRTNLVDTTSTATTSTGSTTRDATTSELSTSSASTGTTGGTMEGTMGGTTGGTSTTEMETDAANTTMTQPPPVCGNGVQEADEACDEPCVDCDFMVCTKAMTQDEATKCAATAPCRLTCTWNSGENKTSCLGCDLPLVCGDGKLNQDVEECDDGNENFGDGCGPTCKKECGDGDLNDPLEECDDGGLMPWDGCSAECKKEWFMFVTSASFTGALDGLEGADAKCQAAAAAGQLAGTYKAWLSIQGMDAKDRGFPAGTTIVNTEGDTIVADASKLFTGDPNVTIELDNPFLDETDKPVMGSAWTGTTPAGTWSGDDCNKWTSSANTDAGDVGYITAQDKTWTKLVDAQKCDTLHHLYCFRTQ